MKDLTIGIPAYHAEELICDALASIQIQTCVERIKVVIAPDDPKDNYTKVLKYFPNLEIKILKCEENTGPGLARQRILDACDTEWISFMDADDVLYNPFAIEQLFSTIEDDTFFATGYIAEEMYEGCENRITVHTDILNAYVNGHLFNMNFIRMHDIRFSSLRSCEDAEFILKFIFFSRKLDIKLKQISEIVYLWRNTKNSITHDRLNEHLCPQHTYDLNDINKVQSAINNYKWLEEHHENEDEIVEYLVNHLVERYFTWHKSTIYNPMFTEQIIFCEKWLFVKTLADKNIPNALISKLYAKHNSCSTKFFEESVPSLSFPDFMKKVLSTEYRGKEELLEIRSKYPSDVIEYDLSRGFDIDVFDL